MEKTNLENTNSKKDKVKEQIKNTIKGKKKKLE